MSLAHFGHTGKHVQGVLRTAGGKAHGRRRAGSHKPFGSEGFCAVSNLKLLYRTQKGMHTQDPLAEPLAKAPKEKAPPEPQNMQVTESAPKETAKETPKASTVRKSGREFGWGEVAAWANEYLSISVALDTLSGFRYRAELNGILLPASKIYYIVSNRLNYLQTHDELLMRKLEEQGLFETIDNKEFARCIKLIEKSRGDSDKGEIGKKLSGTEYDVKSLERAQTIISKHIIINFVHELEKQRVFEEPQKSEAAF